MPDVTINRCTLRIVRHGGWSWGASPEKLLQGAIKILPELIARELGQFWGFEGDDDDEEIAAPLRISVPIHLNELLAISGAGIHESEFSYSSEFSVVGQRINSAIRAALIDKRAWPDMVGESQTTTLRLREEVAVAEHHSGSESFVVEVLRAWQGQGVLAQRLSVFSTAALEAWQQHIVKTSDDETVFGSEQISSMGSLIEECLRVMPLTATIANRDAVLRRRLIVIAELMARFDLVRCPVEVLLKLDEVISLSMAETSHDQAVSLHTMHDGDAKTAISRTDGLMVVEDELSAQRDAGKVGESPGRIFSRKGAKEDAKDAKVSRKAAKEDAKDAKKSHASLSASFAPFASSFAPLREKTSSQLEPSTSEAAKSHASQQPIVGSPTSTQPVSTHQSLQPITRKLRCDATALPFLLLGPLARTGYLQTLNAVLEASENTAASPLFATALAYKLLEPPERGWRRSAATLSTAAAFAALETPAPEPALMQFAQTVSPHLSPLDATLSGALIAGHTARVPLLLLSSGEGLLLFDTEGVFPIQWANKPAELRSTLIQLDSSIVFVPRASADVELLRWLKDEGLNFVTDAPPTRGESLRSIRRPPDLRWWTNDETSPDSVFAKMASTLPAAVEDALELVQGLAKDRPAIPLARDSALDRHLTVAVAVALGTIAWELWKEREHTAPHLALERFADLQARVDYSEDVVTVSLPLGKRFLDLRTHDLLEDVHDVPWFDGRKLIFTSG